MRNPVRNDLRETGWGLGTEDRRGGARVRGWGCRADSRLGRLEAESGRAHAGGGPGGVVPRAARVHRSCGAQAGWRVAGPQRHGVRAPRRAEGHGRLSGPGRRCRRRGSARLRPVWPRLRLRTRDQNSLSGADAAPAGFSGKAARARGPCVSLRPRPAMAAVALAAGAGPGGRQPLPHIPRQDSGVSVGPPVWGLRTGLG